MKRVPFSYRNDHAVPDFDDTKPLFVFDNICVLCSGGASWLMRLERAGDVQFTAAQGELGEALYRHYGMAMDDTYLFIANGRAWSKSEGYFQLAKQLGGIWKLSAIIRIVPRPLRDAFYDMIARNRYRLFGKTEACALLTEEQRARLI